jgi:putative glutamine amidotransferase
VSSSVGIEDVVPARRGLRTGPRVAVLGSLNIPGQNDHVASLITRFTRTVLQEIEDAGGDWSLVDTSAALPSSASVLDADAVLLLGGGDVDSECYGVAGPAPHEWGVDVDADTFCLEVIRDAVVDDVPVLGICRGAQLLNVAFGGTLVPDIEAWSLHHGPYEHGLMIDEHVSVLPGTRLAGILGTTSLTVRSGHHQAVADVASALRLAAVADDGVVEAVEHPDAWAVGVQWHPEDDDGPGDDRRALVAALLVAAAARTQAVTA